MKKKELIFSMQCPKCENEKLNYLPWLGQIWECRKCGYRGPLALENLEKKLQLLLLKIPKGRVTSYSELAKKLNLHPRAVAKLLKRNPRPNKYPCYKVVYSSGKIGGYIKGLDYKIKKLKKDGIEVKDKRINLKKFLFKFS